MLIGNCDIKEFFVIGEYNTSVTVVPKQKGRYVQKDLADKAWRETFRDSLGGGIVHDSKTEYLVSCKTKNGTINLVAKGNEIVNACWENLCDIDIVRLSLAILPANANKVHSWIIMRVEE